jgi:predicted dinucleotide-binding enzyme
MEGTECSMAAACALQGDVPADHVDDVEAGLDLGDRVTCHDAMVGRLLRPPRRDPDLLEIACLATAWTGAENAITLAGAGNLAGKVVIDVTNPLGFGPSGPSLVVGHDDSAGEQVQRWLPDSRVVKTWNTVNHAHMIDSHIPGGPGDMFLCGDEAAAKQTVAELLQECGWPPLDVGGIVAARLVESLALMWISYAISAGSSDHGFKLLRQPPH